MLVDSVKQSGEVMLLSSTAFRSCKSDLHPWSLRSAPRWSRIDAYFAGRFPSYPNRAGARYRRRQTFCGSTSGGFCGLKQCTSLSVSGCPVHAVASFVGSVSILDEQLSSEICIVLSLLTLSERRLVLSSRLCHYSYSTAAEIHFRGLRFCFLFSLRTTLSPVTFSFTDLVRIHK